MLRPLTFENIAEIDAGKIKVAFEQHLQKLVADCAERPGNETARTLSLQLNVVPVIDPDNGNCDDVNIEFEIGSKVPKHRSRMVNCNMRKTNSGQMLVFNDLSEDDAEQKTLDQQSDTFRPENSGGSQSPAA
jgi:hypothetical protein